jgi:glycosyltransferase involved in cell wall biosynthesis
MILYFSFNMGEDDFSGLPTYSKMFLDHHKGDAIVINVIANPNCKYAIGQRTDIEDYIWYDCFCPEFLSSFYPQLENLLLDLLEQHEVSKIILPDYLLQKYTENLPLKEKGIEKVLFVHLLYRGMLDRFMKEPYFLEHLQTGMTYLTTVAWNEWKAVVTSDTIICNSEFTASDLKHFYWDAHLDSKQIHTLPLGVHKDHIPYQPANDRTQWAYFGRLETQKGLWYILKDISINTEKYQKRPITICGDGTLEVPFMKGDFYGDGVCRFYGLLPKEKLYTILADVKYCIFPSIYEPWGLALTEAMAMGKICIVQPVNSGLTEQIQHGLNGLYFDFQNNSIIEYLDYLDSQDIEWERISQNARETARNMSDHLEQLMKVLSSPKDNS